MIKGVCTLSSIPVRKADSSASELVSMLLFGETYTVIEDKSEWKRIETDFDGYSGWINERQFTPLNTSISGETIIHDFPFAIGRANNEQYYLLPGSRIEVNNEGRYTLNGITYELTHGQSAPEGIIETAKQFLGAPYLWGGRSAFGIDCSGLTQVVFKLNGIKLRRDAAQQAEQGELVAFRTEVKAGDLAFFDNADGRITHVGIMLDPDHILHASGKVRIDKIDDHGIFCVEENRYTHKLRIIKRYHHSSI